MVTVLSGHKSDSKAFDRYWTPDDDIRQSIFVNGDQSYFSTMGSINRYWRQGVIDLHEKYRPAGQTHSEWRGNLIFFLFMWGVYIPIELLPRLCGWFDTPIDLGFLHIPSHNGSEETLWQSENTAYML